MPSLEWQIAMVVLDHPALRGRVDHYLDHDAETIAADITAEPWSSGQLEIIEVVLALLAQRRIKTPNCPVCGTPPFRTHFEPWLCPNDACEVLAWPPAKSIEELLSAPSQSPTDKLGHETDDDAEH